MKLETIFKNHWLGLMFIFGITNVVGLLLLYTIAESLWYLDWYDGVFLNGGIAIFIYYLIPFALLKLTFLKQANKKYSIFLSIIMMILSFFVFIFIDVMILETL